MSPKRQAGSRKHLPFVIIAAVLVVALGAGLALFRTERKATAPTPIPPNLTVQRPVMPGAQPPHIRGAAGAAVTIEEFGDFQCPPCAALHPELKKIEADYGSRLRVIFRNFPLTSIHNHAVDAARAAEAAALQGRFWEMHDLLYENQRSWSAATDARALFVGYARQLGLDAERFTRDMDAGEVAARIAADQRRGAALGVTGTPTVLLNGRELPQQSMTIQGIRAEIDAALGGKK